MIYKMTKLLTVSKSINVFIRDFFRDTMKTALIIGASRGIGRQIALTLAKNGFRVGVASKTTKHTDKLPGTIYSVCNEIEQSGGIAIPIKVSQIIFMLMM